jgi:uncharacterized Tic20 family protein
MMGAMNDIREAPVDWLPIPQPEEITKREREDAFGSYIMMFAGTYFPLPLIEVLAAAIYYKYFKRKSRFVAFNSLQSLYMQIPVSLVSLAAVGWGIGLAIAAVLKKAIGTGQIVAFVISLIGIVGVNIAYIVVSLVAAFAAKKGRFHYFPWAGPAAFAKVYGPGRINLNEEEPKPVPRNEPPN